jgi:hypothetical protein
VSGGDDGAQKSRILFAIKTTPLFGRQINPRKSKGIQTKELGFPWIPLGESGLSMGYGDSK